MESYATGETSPALIEETIGANFESTVASYGDNEALVEFATGRRWTYAELDRDVNALARGLIGAGIEKGDRVGIWSPNRAEWTLTQYATAKIGAVLVNVNPAYRTHEFSFAVNQSGLSLLVAATSSRKNSDYRGMIEETRENCPNLRRVVYLDTDEWTDLLGQGDPLPQTTVAEKMATLDPLDAHQHSVHEGHHRRPQGCDARATATCSTTETSRPRLINFAEEDRLCIPVPSTIARHGDRQPRLQQPRGGHGDPGAGLRPGRRWTRSRRNAARASTACRPCSSRCLTRRISPFDSPHCVPECWQARRARSR